MAVNFLTLRSAVANDIAVQHLTYSTMVGHPTASHQTVQAIVASSIMTMGHVGIGATTALSGTALNVVGSTMISGNITIDNGTTGQFVKNGSTAGYNMNINGGNSTNSPNVDFYSAGTRKMYVGNANTTDTFIYAENGVKLNLGTNGIQRMYINSDGDVDVSGRELRVSQLNGNGQVRLKSGNRQQSAIFHCNDDWFYFLATDNGNWLSGANAIRPIRYNLTSGLVVMDNGATINGGLTCNSINVIPYGSIIMWYGSIASIPAGWALCNGANGTPDLRDRFVVGAGYSYSPGNTGGANSVTLTTAQIPSHRHRTYVWDMWRHADGTVPNYNNWGNYTKYLYGVYAREQNQNGGVEDWNGLYDSETAPTGSDNSHENRPPYYALCYIMRTN